MYLKQINGNILDLSGIPSFRDHYNNQSSYAAFILNQINTGHFYGITSGDVALDIGANVGLFTAYLAPNFKKIIAVEPSPEHFKILQEIVIQKGLTNVIPINGALFDRNMDMSIHFNSNNTTMNNLVCSFGETPSIVKAFTLETLLNDNQINIVDLMKMDIEGSEMKIIPDNTFHNCRHRIKCLTVEVHDFIMGGHLLGANTDYIELLLKCYEFNTIRRGLDSIYATRN